MIEYKEKYRYLCSDLNDCTCKEQVKKHNYAMKQLSELYKQVANLDDKSFLLDLLSEDDCRSQVLVAAHCLGLGVYIREAKKVLTQISRRKDVPILAFEAQATLDVWKKQGFLDF